MTADYTDALRQVLVDYASPDPSTLAKLPKPTRKDNPKGKCDVCGGWHGLPAVHLDYMGHADVTKALINVDPEWNWRPAALTADGEPKITLKDGQLKMWGYLTVLGVERLGVGTCESNKPEAEKELIGDLLRNVGMRFGIGVNLWSKSDSADPASSAPERQPAQRTAARVTKASEAQITKLVTAFGEFGVKQRDERLRYLTKVAGREITSSKDLTSAEASKAIEAIELAIRMEKDGAA